MMLVFLFTVKGGGWDQETRLKGPRLTGSFVRMAAAVAAAGGPRRRRSQSVRRRARRGDF